jgi:DNA polymerase-3 subunit alpha
MWNTGKKTQVTCFPMSDVDSRMFVKQDFLGLANLDVLDEWCAMVEPLVGEIDWKGVEKDHDPQMWNLLEQGLTLGIFQIEDGYARHLCKEIKPKSISDLGVIVALNRPGPIRSGAPDSFITRRNGYTDNKFDGRNIPILADILEPTYGWFLYQEQIIKFMGKLGYDLSDADAVRKILGKKKPEDMKALKDGTGEWKNNGYFQKAEEAGLDATTAAEIWTVIEDFAKYSFNKSHAICYAVVGFRTMYAKYNSPRHFFIACIRVATQQKKDKEDIGKFVGEARRMGIAVLPPDIDRSSTDIGIGEDDNIYFGFSNVKGIGKGAGDFLCKLRDTYTIRSPEDIFDTIETIQKDWEIERDAAKAEGKPFNKKSPRQTFPSNRISPLHQAGAFDRYEDRDLSMTAQQKLEKELLGVIITDNCEEIFAANHTEVEECDTYTELDLSDGHQVYVPGIVSKVVPKKTRKDNKSMGIVTIEYRGDQAEFVVFPREWRNFKFLWKERTPGIFALAKTDRGIRFEQAIQLK